MITVPRKDFSFIIKKLKVAPTFVYSVLDSTIQGTVLADSSDYNALLIHTKAGLYYITGKVTNKLLENLVAIFEERVDKGERFTLFSYTSIWSEAIEQYFNKDLRKIERYAFSFDLLTYKNRQRNEVHDYEISKITSSIVEYSQEFNKKYYDEYWDSVNNFLENGVGFCLIDKQRIISEAVSIFKCNNYAEIDIVTDLNYRGKGLAVIVAEQFINDCLIKNIQPRWDCDIDNSASIKLGNKLGFIDPIKYDIYTKRTI